MGRRSWVDEVSEYAIQDYVVENFRKLGFTRIEGPFSQGPDFEGEVDGEPTRIEVESECKDYLIHGRQEDPDYDHVGVLVVLNQTKPRGALRSLLPNKIIAIDQQDFENWLTQKQEMRERRDSSLKKHFEGIEIRLERDNEILFSSSTSNPNLDLEGCDCGSLAGYYSLAANEKRLKLMQELLKRRKMRFSDILQITGNPKLVGDCVNPLIERGMIVHDYDHNYKITGKGDLISNYLLVALPLIRRFLEKIEEESLSGPDAIEEVEAPEEETEDESL
jgi:hypothetical protein